MNARRLLVVTVLVAACALCAVTAAKGTAATQASPRGVGQPSAEAGAPGAPAPSSTRVIVKYRVGVTAAAARAHAKGLGAAIRDQIVGPAVPHGRLVVVTSSTHHHQAARRPLRGRPSCGVRRA